MFKQYRHIHFVGIGGVGMSGIAEVLLNLGYAVSGSDQKRSLATRRLKSKGAQIFLGHDARHVNGGHAVVYSSAIGFQNPELMEAKAKGIPLVGRSEMIAELMRLKYGIAVAGSHGKTTTTSLIGTVLDKVGLDPTLLVGGRLNNFRSNAKLGRGEFFVVESDESDQSFLKLNPTIAVITNIDREHLENYRSFLHLQECFLQFADKVPFYGSVILCQDDPHLQKLIPQIRRPLIRYGFHPDAQFRAGRIRQEGAQMYFDVTYKNRLLGEAKIGLPGIHYVSNALAAVAVATQLEIPWAKIKKGLEAFRGIGRRFEILRKAAPMVVDDYAHHPAEIRATLQAASLGWPEKKKIVCWQPHRYTRLQNLFREFVKCFQDADSCLVLPLYPAGETPIPGVDAEVAYRAIRKASKGEVAYEEEIKKGFEKLATWASGDSIVLFLGAGDITKYAREFVKWINRN